MRMATLPAALACAAMLGCGGKQDQRGLGEQVGDAGADTAVLREASDAANAVIRAAPDCDAVKAALQSANPKLDQAQGRLKTATGRVSFAALRQQVRHVAEACP
jgi:hypothetical protein